MANECNLESMPPQAERIVAGNLISDGRTVQPYEPLVYTQAQVDALVRREVDSECEVWKSRLENATAQIRGLQAQVQNLIASISDGRAFLPSPPMIIQGATQSQVDALVKAETERCASIPQEAAIRLIGGRKRVNQIDTHVSYVLTDIAKQIRSTR